MTAPLPEGKLPPSLLAGLLAAVACDDPRVAIGCGVGDDAAAIAMDRGYLIVASDPITFTARRPGWHALHVNMNDVATMGAEPKWFLATILFPAGRTTESMVRDLFAELDLVCRQNGVTLCGGHTEITSAVTRTVVVGQILGEVEQDRLVDGRRLEPGDRLVQAGPIAVEGSAILASELSERLEGRVEAGLLASARGLLETVGISVLPAARAAAAAVRVRSMHDPTEGGLATACHEMARLAGVGIEIDRGAIRVLPETRALCEALGLDPLGTLASGTLLVGVSAGDVGALLEALAARGIEAAEIGCVIDDASRRVLLDGFMETPLPLYHRDEILRVLP